MLYTGFCPFKEVTALVGMRRTENSGVPQIDQVDTFEEITPVNMS